MIRRISPSSKHVQFLLRQSPRVDLSSSYDLGIILKWFGQRLDDQSSTVKLKFIWNPRKSNVVNYGQLCMKSWIWRWEMVWKASFMSIQVSFDISKIKIEEFEVRWKVSKNSKWPVISNCQKWKGLLLKFTSSYKLQMEFCPTWKLNILLSPFQKVQEHPFLICGWRDMDQSWPSEYGTSNRHNFQTKCPN